MLVILFCYSDIPHDVTAWTPTDTINSDWYIYKHTYRYTHTKRYISTNTNTQTYNHTRTHTQTHTQIHIQTPPHTDTYTNTHTYTHIQKEIYPQTQIYTRIHTKRTTIQTYTQTLILPHTHTHIDFFTLDKREKSLTLLIFTFFLISFWYSFSLTLRTLKMMDWLVLTAYQLV